MLVHSMCQPGRARPPGALPRRLAGASPLPEGEVHGVFLVLVDLDAAAGLHALQGAVAQLTVAVAPLYPEKHVSAGGIGMARSNQLADGRYDRADFLRGLGVDVGTADVQGVHGLEEIVNEPLGQLRGFDTLFLGPLDDLVVDVSEVLHVLNVVSLILQIAAQDVESDIA